MIEKESFIFIVAVTVFALLYIVAQLLFLRKVLRNDKKTPTIK
jgi:hypothetical protein